MQAKTRIRPEKQWLVAELQERLRNSPVVFLADNDGMDMARTHELRRTLRALGARYQVVPNGLFARAAADACPGVADGLSGSTAVVYGNDPVETARAVWQFARQHEKPGFKRASFSGRIHPGEVVGELAVLPDRPVLQAILLGTLAAPMRQLAGVFHQKVASLLYALRAARDQREGAAG